MCTRVFEGGAQQFAEAGDHPIGQIEVFLHEGRDGVERIEQEVRVELHFEHLQLRLSQPGFELGGAALAVAKLAVIVEGVDDNNDAPVDPDVQHGVRDQLELKKDPKR